MKAPMKTPLLLALLLLAALLPTSPAGAQAPAADLRVTVRLTGAQPQIVDGTATAGTVESTITNVGSSAAPYTLTYEWVGATTRFLNQDQVHSVDTSSQDGSPNTVGPLQPGQSRTHTMPWTLQPDEVGAGAVRVTVTFGNVAHTGQQDCSVAAHPCFIASHHVTATFLGDALTLLPGEVRFLRAAIENTGNVPEVLRLGLANPEQHGDGIDNTQLRKTLDTTQLTVEAHASGVATLFLDRSPDLAARPFTAGFTLWAQTEFGRNVTSPPSPPISSNDSADGYPVGFAHSLQSGPSLLFVPASGPASQVEAILSNLGDPTRGTTFADSYHVRGTVDPGWSVTAPSSPVGLFAGESVRVAVGVRPPPDSPPGTRALLNLSVESDHGSPPRWLDVPLQVSGPAVAITAAALQATPYLGDEGDAVVDLLNRGDQPMPGSDLHLSIVPAAATQPAVTAAVAPLPPGASTRVTVHVGAFGLAGPAMLVAAWSDATSSLPVQQLQVPIFVHDPVLQVTAPAPLAGIPGEQVGYLVPPSSFRVRNDGNSPETIEAMATAAFGQAALEGDHLLSIAPGETRTIPVSHLLPMPVGRATVANLTLLVHVAGRPATNWQATVATRITDLAPPRIALLAPPPTRWTLHEPMPLAAAVTDDGAVDRVDLHVQGPGTNVTTSLALQGAAWHGTALFATAGNFTVTVRARDAAGNQANSSWMVAASPVPPPKVRFEGIPPILRNDAIIRVNATDALGLASLTLRVAGRDAKLALATAGIAQADLAKLALPPGNYTLIVEAVDLAGAHANATALVVLQAPPPASPTSSPVAAKKTSFPAAGLVLLALALASRRGRPKTCPAPNPA